MIEKDSEYCRLVSQCSGGYEPYDGGVLDTMTEEEKVWMAARIHELRAELEKAKFEVRMYLSDMDICEKGYSEYYLKLTQNSMKDATELEWILEGNFKGSFR